MANRRASDPSSIDYAKIREGFAELAVRGPARRGTSRLEQIAAVKDDIAALLAQGISFADITTVLNEGGLKVSAATLRHHIKSLGLPEYGEDTTISVAAMAAPAGRQGGRARPPGVSAAEKIDAINAERAGKPGSGERVESSAVDVDV